MRLPTADSPGHSLAASPSFSIATCPSGSACSLAVNSRPSITASPRASANRDVTAMDWASIWSSPSMAAVTSRTVPPASTPGTLLVAATAATPGSDPRALMAASTYAARACLESNASPERLTRAARKRSEEKPRSALWSARKLPISRWAPTRSARLNAICADREPGARTLRPAAQRDSSRVLRQDRGEVLARRPEDGEQGDQRPR